MEGVHTCRWRRYTPGCGGGAHLHVKGVHTCMWRIHTCMWRRCTPVCGGMHTFMFRGCTPVCGGFTPACGRHACMWWIHTFMFKGCTPVWGVHTCMWEACLLVGGCTPTCGGLRLMLRLFLHSSPTFVQTEALTPPQNSLVRQISLTNLCCTERYLFVPDR